MHGVNGGTKSAIVNNQSIHLASWRYVPYANCFRDEARILAALGRPWNMPLRCCEIDLDGGTASIVNDYETHIILMTNARMLLEARPYSSALRISREFFPYPPDKGIMARLKRAQLKLNRHTTRRVPHQHRTHSKSRFVQASVPVDLTGYNR